MSESERIEALVKTGLLDTPAEKRFDRLTRLAASALDTEIAAISFIDSDRQWFKSKHGIDLDGSAREHAFCNHAIRQPNEVMVVRNAAEDDRFRNNPFVTAEDGIAFYAGAPLVTGDGHAIGALCVIDSERRDDFGPEEQQILKDLADSVMAEIKIAAHEQEIDDLGVINQELQHRMGNMYAQVGALVSMLSRSEVDHDQFVRRLHENIASLAKTQALLAANNWERAPLSAVVDAVLSPFRKGDAAQRVSIDTRDDFDITAKGAFILSLVLHELGTNAVKHGALAGDAGRISVSSRSEDAIIFRWEERGGQQASDALGLGTGFGSQILQRIAPTGLGGKATFELHPEGLDYELSADPALLCAA